MLTSVESHADSRLARTASSARSVDVGVDLFWRLELHNQVDLGDVQASGRDVGGDQAFQFALFESLECDLPLFLGDVAVEHLGFLLKIGFQQDLVGFFLGLAENDGSSVATTIKVHDVSDDRVSVVVWAAECHVLNGFGGPHARILN